MISISFVAGKNNKSRIRGDLLLVTNENSIEMKKKWIGSSVQAEVVITFICYRGIDEGNVKRLVYNLMGDLHKRKRKRIGQEEK